ncbi:MAG: hypothetical protein OEZ08_03760 [Betaproteobacteria bacterium]|nr:hypothetical protein [Betaproteobacteria bacterium]
MQYKNSNSMQVEQVYCDGVHKAHYYVVSISAPSLYYFNRYQPAFEKVLATFRLS